MTIEFRDHGPSVQAARQRHLEAQAEYRALLHKEMLRIDPTVKPLLDTMTELKDKNDY